MRRRLLVACLIGIVAFPAAWSADYTVKAYTQPAAGFADDRPFQFVIQVEGVGNPRVEPPRLQGLKNLSVVGGPSTNSSFVWRNGRSSANYKLVYTLLPTAPGPASIPALELKVDSRVYATQALELTVADAASPPTRPQQRRNQRPTREDRKSSDIFIRAELGTIESWVGQAIPLDVTLYTVADISSPRWMEQPDFADFWVESIDVDPNREKFETRIGDRVYDAFPIDRRMLVPPTSGEFELEPYVAQMQVRTRRADPFDIFSLGRTQTIVRKTKPLKLVVKRLPSGRPEDFSGAVGKFNAKASLDQTETTVDKAVALKLTVSGEGSLRSISAPKFEPGPDLKVFEPKIAQSFDVSRGTMRSTKSWEWIIVPLTPGDLELPAFNFAYFNPATSRYETSSSGALTVAVERGNGSEVGPLARGGIQLQRRDLNFIKPLRGDLREGGVRAHQQGSFLALLLLPLALAPLFIVAGRQRERLQRDLGKVRARRARSRARKRLQAITRRRDEEDSASFHEQVARTLVEYVADRFNRSAAGLTYDLTDDLLGSKGVDSELRRRFRATLETCDYARFVPAAGKAERRTEVLAEASSLIQDLESAW